MSHRINGQSASEVSFGRTKANQPVIVFFDPSYVRSEAIVFESKTGEVHAVLHENLHFLGTVPKEYNDSFREHGSVLLSASHYTGQSVEMTAPLSIVKN